MAHHIDDYIRAMGIKGEEQFQRDYSTSVIIGLRVVGDLSEDGERGEAQTFLAALHGQEQETQSLNRRVWPLVKSAYGPQTPYIRVGRSSKNDVVIPEYSISQVHCEFALTPDGHIRIVDLGSHNGTLINGKALEPRIPYVMEDEDELVLGRYLFEFLEAETFIGRVSVMGGRKVA